MTETDRFNGSVVRPLVGVVLAGGLSRRMGGGDKGLLPLGSISMIGHVVERIAPQVDRLVLNANGDPVRFASLGLPVAPDRVGDNPGPLAGVLAGLLWASEHAPSATHVVTVSSDAPFIPRDLVDRLAAASQAATTERITMARSDNGLHPVIGLWPIALREDLRDALVSGTRKVLHWTDRHGVAECH
ncbi:MAG: molybdenum cofactor guanylyltransferase MobA, partial [Pseudomonadota bacterium]